MAGGISCIPTNRRNHCGKSCRLTHKGSDTALVKRYPLVSPFLLKLEGKDFRSDDMRELACYTETFFW